MNVKYEWRRFKLIAPEKEEALTAMLNEKGITREDLILIFQTLELRCV